MWCGCHFGKSVGRTLCDVCFKYAARPTAASPERTQILVTKLHCVAIELEGLGHVMCFWHLLRPKRCDLHLLPHCQLPCDVLDGDCQTEVDVQFLLLLRPQDHVCPSTPPPGGFFAWPGFYGHDLSRQGNQFWLDSLLRHAGGVAHSSLGVGKRHSDAPTKGNNCQEYCSASHRSGPPS
jgi:hypothetical protein